MGDDLKREQLAEWLRSVALTDKSDLVRLIAAFEEGIFAPAPTPPPKVLPVPKSRIRELHDRLDEALLIPSIMPKPLRRTRNPCYPEGA